MTSQRRYPDRPILGVGGVVLMGDGRVVLVKRKYEPAAGTWTLPGGAVEIGETARAAAAREILEETGLVVDVGPVVDVIDRIFRDEDGRVEYQYVVVDYACTPQAGTLAAGSDVDEVALAGPADLDRFALTEAVKSVLARVFPLSVEN